MVVEVQTREEGKERELLTMLSSCLSLRSNAFDLCIGCLDMVAVFGVRFAHRLADGQELKPCFMAKQSIHQVVQAANLCPECVDRLAGLAVMVYDLQVEIRCHTHNYPKSLMLGHVPPSLFSCIGRVGWINVGTCSIQTWLNDTDVVSGTGEEGNHLDLPPREVTPCEQRYILILAGIIVRHDDGVKARMSRATVWIMMVIRVNESA